MDPSSPLHVFAYGSLIWRPGFPFVAREAALLRGFHRRFCLWSRLYRGTPERPGLVLGLDRGGSCQGVVFTVAPEHAPATRAYLRERENPRGEDVYHERLLPVRLASGATLRALCYVADRRHPAYARPCAETTARVIAAGRGEAGTNRDYLLNTLATLRDFGLRDRALEGIAARLDGRVIHAPGASGRAPESAG